VMPEADRLSPGRLPEVRAGNGRRADPAAVAPAEQRCGPGAHAAGVADRARDRGAGGACAGGARPRATRAVQDRRKRSEGALCGASKPPCTAPRRSTGSPRARTPERRHRARGGATHAAGRRRRRRAGAVVRDRDPPRRDSASAC
jgi:hypothetical protein